MSVKVNPFEPQMCRYAELKIGQRKMVLGDYIGPSLAMVSHDKPLTDSSVPLYDDTRST